MPHLFETLAGVAVVAAALAWLLKTERKGTDDDREPQDEPADHGEP
jgi:hypothetical protein